ncbi:MAG: hypothetical protein ACYCZF_16635 [Anaerolineae bacterium]
MLSRFFTWRYWLLPVEGPLGDNSQVMYALVASMFAAGAMIALYTALRSRQFATRPFLIGVACLAGTLGALSRFVTLISFARWLVAFPAGAAVCIYCMRWWCAGWPVVKESWIALWNWRTTTMRLAWQPAIVIWVIHLAALCILTRPLGWSLWAAPLVMAIGLSPQIIPSLRRSNSPLVLNALLPCYLLAMIEIVGRLGWQISIITTPVLTLSLVMCVVYAWSYQVLTRAGSKLVRSIPWSLIAACGALVLGWAVWTYLSLAARGVAGSDPYCYIQMAVDWARSGSFLHHFPLARDAALAGISLEPILHTGYRLPLIDGEWAATVWPVGHAWLLGMIGRVFGLEAIYRGTPLMAVLAVLASALLALLASVGMDRRLRWIVAILTGFLTATSYELVSWTLVHMADISALLFSVICFILAWQSSRHSVWGWVLVAASGAALGMAYWARHTQLVMFLPASLLILGQRKGLSRGSRLLRVIVFGTAALIVALPDLAYHKSLFGSIWVPESNELSLYALEAIPRTSWLLIRQWSASREFLYILPFIIIGGYTLYRRQRLLCIALLLWLGASWAFHAPYAALRLRDLLPVLPVLALFAAYGTVVCLCWLAQRRRSAAVGILMVLIMFLYLRSAKTINLPISRGYNNFGYLWASQRQEFMDLSETLPPDAVIAATLGSGPLDLYTGRETFQPTIWSDEELRRFMDVLRARGTPLYALDDSLAMTESLPRWRSLATLTVVATLHQVPYYYPGGGSDNRDIVLYHIEP